MRALKRGSKLSEEIARDLLAQISAGGLAAGSQLPPETQMLSQYGVGRATLREALRILEVHGIIRIKSGPGGGPVVVGPTPHDFGRMATLFFKAGGMTFREIMEARLFLEPLMARLAAERQNAELVAELLALETLTENDEAYLRSSASFHWQVGSMSGNRVLNLIAHALEEVFHDRVKGMLFPPERRGDVVAAHAAIAQAIAQGDALGAERAMRAHMLDYVRYVEQRYPALVDEVVDWV